MQIGDQLLARRARFRIRIRRLARDLRLQLFHELVQALASLFRERGAERRDKDVALPQLRGGIVAIELRVARLELAQGVLADLFKR